MIHATLSTEARDRLRRQKRISTIASIVVSIVAVALIALILGIFLLPNILKENPVIVTYKANTLEEQVEEPKKVQMKLACKP